MAFLTENTEKSARSINPWSNSRIDVKTQTGGDWYNILLTASLNGKVIHGANTSPTNEVLCKASHTSSYFNISGKLKWDPEEKELPSIGSDISDGAYIHHMYRGTMTSSGALLAFEAGLWEPSIRSRAKSTSILAAGLVAHGCSLNDAIKIVGTMACDDIDIEAVSSTILPASHLKREMTVISKANHRVFGKGTIQSGITWDDSRLSIRGGNENVALDWGRLTAIARYIAEANIQLDPNFRLVARLHTVPFYLVRNSWAYVTETDYRLDPKLYSGIRTFALSKYHIPSIKGAFLDHEIDILIASTRYLNSDAGTLKSAGSALNVYRVLYEKAKNRREAKHRKRMAFLTDFRDVPVTSHSITAEDASALFDDDRLIWKAIREAVATRKKYDPLVNMAISRFSTYSVCGDKEVDKIDHLTTIIFATGTWTIALQIYKDMLSPYTDTTVDAVSKLGAVKQRMFGHPTHLLAPIMFTPDIIVRLRNHTKDLLSTIDDVSATDKIATGPNAIPGHADAMRAMTDLADKAVEILPIMRETISARYDEEIAKFDGFTGTKVQKILLHYKCASLATRRLTITDCMNRASGYIDGAAPTRSYIYAIAKRMARDTDTKVPTLKRLVYKDVYEIARELDDADICPHSFEDACSYTTDIITSVVMAIFESKVWDIGISDLYEVPEECFRSDSPGYNTTEVEAEERRTALAATFAYLESEDEDVTWDDDEFSIALNTYDKPTTAETYAKLNGYDSFRSAFDDLGTGSYHDFANEFTTSAIGKLAEKRGNRTAAKKARVMRQLI